MTRHELVVEVTGHTAVEVERAARQLGRDYFGDRVLQVDSITARPIIRDTSGRAALYQAEVSLRPGGWSDA